MIHRFVDLPSVKKVMIPFTIEDERPTTPSVSFDVRLAWISEEPGQDLTVNNPSFAVSELSGDFLCDAAPAPDGRTVVFAYMNASGQNGVGGFNQDGAGWVTTTGIGSLQPSLLFVSMQPWWRPDGTGIVYRTLDDSPNNGYIRTCDIDVTDGSSSNDTLLLTLDRSTVGRPFAPTYSYDGTKIVYGIIKDAPAVDELWVMNADGSSPTKLSNLTNVVSMDNAFSVFNTSNAVAYCKKNGSNTEIRKINLDGTGDTLLYTDTSPFFGLSRRAVATDDSAVFYFKRTSTTVDPQFTLYTIDPAGGGASALDASFTTYGSSNDDMCQVYGDRIYWQSADTFNDGTDHAVLVSCKFDGSDLRTEVDFQADIPTGYTSIDWIGGFTGFNNQPE